MSTSSKVKASTAKISAAKAAAKKVAPKKVVPKRAPGRPSVDSTVDVRGALIEATRLLLRDTPPERLSIKDVAAKAHVTPALVRYYFGSKEGLLSTTVASQLENLQALGSKAVEASGPIEQRLGDRLKAVIDQVQQNPRFTQMVMDCLYTSTTKESELMTAQAISRGLMITLSLLHGGPDEKLRPLDPRFVHLTLIGLGNFFASSEPFIHHLFGKDADMKVVTRQYIEFVSDVLLNGIKANSALQDASPADRA